MALLVIHAGNGTYTLREKEKCIYVYRIGAGDVIGDYTCLNDDVLLHHIALQQRDEFSRWVYSDYVHFEKHNIVRDEICLFFLTDRSAKRTEMFETFNTLCNLLVIESKISNKKISRAKIIGASKSFVAAFQSMFPAIDVEIEETRKEKFSLFLQKLRDFRYLIDICIVITLNRLCRIGSSRRVADDNSENMKRVFLSSYPYMFDERGMEQKYGELVGSDDYFLVSIVSDGIHFRTPPYSYLTVRRKLISSERFVVIDDYLHWADIMIGVKWFLKLSWFRRTLISQRYIYRNVDLTESVKVEWILSLSRLVRLMTLYGAIVRYAKSNHINELIYYLHEYPFGRLFTAIFGIHAPEVKRIGFQHGPASWCKLVYFLSEGEGSKHPPYLRKSPLPDAVLAEDDESKKIYEWSGYENVEKMKTIYRLSYLKDIIALRDPRYILIAPGLHDAKILLSVLMARIRNNPDSTYLLKLHPRGKNNELPVSYCDNIQVTRDSIETLLAKVGKVYATYSSVGVEADMLGIDVEIIFVPGIINESPLVMRQLDPGRRSSMLASAG